jgi:hypothetical protein
MTLPAHQRRLFLVPARSLRVPEKNLAMTAITHLASMGVLLPTRTTTTRDEGTWHT